MAGELDFLELVLHSGPVVKAVLLLLLLASVFSWGAIIDRSRAFSKARKTAKTFRKKFWEGEDLGSFFKRAKPKKYGGMCSIFTAGFKEFTTTREHGGDHITIINNSRRAMRVAQNRELTRLENQLTLLATVGSTSPYVGLFGTVWGILNSFQALGSVQQATLSMVAPGIAEALVATALGLFAAIPAVIAYNKYTAEIERLEGEYDDFIEEFTNVLQRQLIR
ncbi:protein TolQ [Solemya velum gill symbiont]|uniref:protein TolQ n=1 Tax=Solemya velum gill symbiont TaxID=2340 RepID=UPI000996A0B3|nr:protein TolQ [Solemya velum gill symbiont]OOY68725.1 protein TolQ [Solemya velum gill symbiont]